MNLDHAIERLYALKVDTTTRDGDGTPHEKPHKPLLLLAACGWSVSLQAVPGASCSGFPNGFPHFHPHPMVPGVARPHLRALRGRPQAERPQQFRPSLSIPCGRRPLEENHNWAMDRNLIAPAPDHHWHVSAILDARRSTGEEQLLTLAGNSLLLPKDRAFHPDVEGLEWRLKKMIA